MRSFVLTILLSCLSLSAAERTSVFPASAKPVGPYSPGIQTTDYVYVSGQGARDSSGALPPTVDGQTKQCLENIKAVLETAGLTMENIVYAHVYLADMSQYDAVNTAYSGYFPTAPPARSTMGVTRMPTDTPVEISAIAIRNKANRRPVTIQGVKSQVPLSAGILTADRYFLSGVLGRDAVSGETPAMPQAQIDIAIKRVKEVLHAARLDAKHLVYLNVYYTKVMPRDQIEKAVHALSSDAAISFVEVAKLPFGTGLGITGVAAAGRAKKMVYAKEGRTICAGAGDVVYCAVQRATDVTAAFSALEPGLKALGTDLTRAVANTVYIDDIENFKVMNAAYAKAFPAPAPTRTTVQPLAAANGPVGVAVVAVR